MNGLSRSSWRSLNRGPTQGEGTRPLTRLDPSVSLVLLGVITVSWGLLMGRFGDDDLYPTLALSTLGMAVVVGFNYDTTLRLLLRPSARHFALGLGVGALMTAATYPAYWLAAEWFPALPLHVAELYEEAQPGSLGVGLVSVVTILIMEELVWRAAWLETLQTYVDPHWAAALSVVLYTGAQLASGSWIVGLLAMCCGSVWTLLRMWTGSLWPPLLAHLVWTPVVILLAPIV